MARSRLFALPGESTEDAKRREEIEAPFGRCGDHAKPMSTRAVGRRSSTMAGTSASPTRTAAAHDQSPRLTPLQALASGVIRGLFACQNKSTSQVAKCVYLAPAAGLEPAT